MSYPRCRTAPLVLHAPRLCFQFLILIFLCSVSTIHSHTFKLRQVFESLKYHALDSLLATWPIGSKSLNSAFVFFAVGGATVVESPISPPPQSSPSPSSENSTMLDAFESESLSDESASIWLLRRASSALTARGWRGSGCPLRQCVIVSQQPLSECVPQSSSVWVSTGWRYFLSNPCQDLASTPLRSLTSWRVSRAASSSSFTPTLVYQTCHQHTACVSDTRR